MLGSTQFVVPRGSDDRVPTMRRRETAACGRGGSVPLAVASIRSSEFTPPSRSVVRSDSPDRRPVTDIGIGSKDAGILTRFGHP